VPTRPEEVACLHNKFAQIIELYVWFDSCGADEAQQVN
jgi:hypothetical protein